VVTDILMPQLSDSMEQGTIARWLVADGEFFAVGDELAEIETDKAAVTYHAETAGMLDIVLAEGQSASVGSVIARTRDDDSSIVETPRARVVTSKTSSPDGPSVEDRMASDLPSESFAEKQVIPSPDGLLATPLARRIASVHGATLTDIAGSGPRGRITRSDVLQAVGAERPSATRTPPRSVSVTPVQAATNVSYGEVEIVPLSSAQKIVAQRMVETKTTTPDFQVQTDVVMDAAIAMRSGLREVEGDGPDPSINDLIVKACGLALRAFPRANGSFRGDHVELFSRINIGVAVAAESALLVPTIFDADQKSLGQIARESRRLAQCVRDKEITPAELSGGTFTISNLGMFGMTAITPVIYGSQAAILGVGALRTTLIRRGDEIVDQTVMTLCASCDHRMIYGADASELLSLIKRLLESPLTLVL
jgi:pyruvate dehydrogenase E2 component (dihydrolipoamide acetyltransferase)